MTTTFPSASSAPASPPSASNSQNSATQPSLPKKPVDAGTSNDDDEKKPDLSSQPDDWDRVEHIEKFRKYEADYTRRLMAKYFSKKNLYGGDIFSDNTTVRDEVIKASRWPCTRSFADPVRSFEDQINNSSTSTAENPTHITNGKHPSKKIGC